MKNQDALRAIIERHQAARSGRRNIVGDRVTVDGENVMSVSVRTKRSGTSITSARALASFDTAEACFYATAHDDMGVLIEALKEAGLLSDESDTDQKTDGEESAENKSASRRRRRHGVEM